MRGKMKHYMIYIVLCLLFFSTTCQANEEKSFEESLEEPLEGSFVLFGAKLSTPQIAALSMTVMNYNGTLIQLEPGISGGKLNIGLGAEFFGYGLGIKASILQTWGSPLGGIEADQIYIGGDFEIMVNWVSLNMGMYGHSAGDDDDRDVILSIGIGYGF